MIKLTIGIPTFNSYNYLKETIDKTIVQIKALEGIEILICDNASEDGTELLVEEYVEKFPRLIRYIRHPMNLGMDRNFWSIIEQARGEYVHFLADDDYYMEKGVERILDKIGIYQLDAILLSNNYLNTRSGKIIENKDSYKGDIACESSGEKFFLHENLKALCLSNVVLRRSKCLEIVDIEKYFGCQWLHLAMLTQIIKPTSSAYIFNFKEPVVTVRIGNQKWLEKDGAVVFYYKALSIFWELKKNGYDRDLLEHIKTLFIPIILNGDRIKFHNPFMNIVYCFKFFRFYKNKPKQYVRFCVNLVLRRYRPFFEGWEKMEY